MLVWLVLQSTMASSICQEEANGELTWEERQQMQVAELISELTKGKSQGLVDAMPEGIREMVDRFGATDLSRLATDRRTKSPAAWPIVSLICLNRSRSIWRAAR